MGDIYKVTAAIVSATKNGFQIYKLELDKSITATKLFPLRELVENGNNLDFMIGKYISIILDHTKYGVEFISIDSFDAILDFKKLLDNSNGKAFSTSMNMYNLLKRKGYPTNKDTSISLRDVYKGFNLTSDNICYPSNLENNRLSLCNIQIIFNHFYKDKAIDNSNPDRDEKYILTPAAIVKSRTSYHKFNGKTLSSDNFDVLRVGDELTEEQYNFILSKGLN